MVVFFQAYLAYESQVEKGDIRTGDQMKGYPGYQLVLINSYYNIQLAQLARKSAFIYNPYPEKYLRHNTKATHMDKYTMALEGIPGIYPRC